MLSVAAAVFPAARVVRYLEGLGRGGAVRRDGHIVPVPAAWKIRQIEFDQNHVYDVVSIPWGDVATAWYSTAIPNIEIYAALPPAQIRALRLSRYLGRLLRSKLSAPACNTVLMAASPDPLLLPAKRRKVSCGAKCGMPLARLCKAGCAV